MSRRSLSSAATTRNSRRRPTTTSGVALRSSQGRSRSGSGSGPGRRSANGRAVSGRQTARPAPFPPAGAGAGGILREIGGLLGPLVTGAARGLAALLRQPDVQRALSGAALLGAVALASHGVRLKVESWPRFAVHTRQLAADGLPHELGPQARADLQRLPLPEKTSSFDPRLVGWVHACLADLPWVQGVDRVRLSAPDRVEFVLRPRLPRARLGEGPDAPVVTEDGAVIPAGYAADPEALPRLLGVPGPSAPTPRREALAAGLAVLETVRGLDFALAAIDLSNLHGQRDPRQSEVVLRDASGLLIEWGRAPDDRPHMSPERQRKALETFLQARGALPALARVSLQWDQVTYALAAPTVAATPAATTPLRAGAPRR